MDRFDTRETAKFASARLDGVLPVRLGFGVRVGADAQFGHDASVPVSLVEPEPALRRLHAAALEALGAQVHLPGAQHNRSNYRPHATRAGEGLRPGDPAMIRQAALVDMLRNNDPRPRRVLAVWEPVQGPIRRPCRRGCPR
ncbi:hypothetical protein [Paeniglutamicibacter psychrophenolicus]|uniref:hypothetical protein n=1 Tax=Paeniglutamicibacter psychrophenolicus TaxID=257454 RepID=UPI002788F7BF|nr:hypothetical protein [Paeniglutamicibacter psychrophenolicus]MDQ0093690.1 hypothetical protein [Paeniglutamicibacter psychrophenolicus]